MTILNQWNQGECAGFSILGALCHMKPDTDYVKIGNELISEKWNELTLQIASKWFIKKGYIKSLDPCGYSPFILKKKPIITWASNVDWIKTWQPPYMLTFKEGNTGFIWSHYFIITELWVIQNSWGENWWDKWYFYFKSDQKSKFKQMFTISI